MPTDPMSIPDLLIVRLDNASVAGAVVGASTTGKDAMRRTIVCSAVAALLAVPSAFAGNGNGQEKKASPQPIPAAPALVEGPTRTSPAVAPAGAITAAVGPSAT